MNTYKDDIETTVKLFVDKIDACNRYASFDYCFNYFHPNSPNSITKDMEKSCMILGFYLASWGMFRGSSFLLDKSAQVFVPLIEYIAQLDISAWKIDAGNLEKNSEQIIEIYQRIKLDLIPKNKSHVTLTTKIMLGVFGSIPAYDRFFTKSFKDIFKGKCSFTILNKNSLICIDNFYNSNSQTIDREAKKLRTLGFNSSSTIQQYTKSKVVDMYGFSKGSNT